jgi:hypothetical protein
MSITQDRDILKNNKEAFLQRVTELAGFVERALQEGMAIHKLELGVWDRVLQLGHDCMGLLFALAGTGDMGETITLPGGKPAERLDKLHKRCYVSIFGRFELSRVVYGSREGQKIDLVPLDNRLQLPESDFSFVLQDWDQSLCVEEAFGKASSTMARILRLKQPVDSLERMNQEMAKDAPTFLLNRPQPETAGEILVLSADGKGVVMRRTADDPAPKAHRTKGDKASQKRMAIVGTAYTVDRHERTAQDVVAALFRDEPKPEQDRPQPQHKHVWASLPVDEEPGSGMERVFAWLVGEVTQRNPELIKPMVYISDGQETLWEVRAEYLPARNTVDILDLLHVTPRLWRAAHVFHREGSKEAEAFVRKRLLRVLQGKAAGVLRRLRALSRQRPLTAAKKKTIRTICTYLRKNLHRMRYDEYLAAGYPIASGAIEGACRHLVKDRMERAGMHWTVAGAQAMLNVRSVYISDCWDEYQAYRIERQLDDLYPHQALVEKFYQLAG